MTNPDYPYIEHCVGCGKTHRSKFAHHACLSYHVFTLILKNDGAWVESGSDLDIVTLPESDPMYHKVRSWIWGWIALGIYRRDKYHCTECGIDVSAPFVTYEAHHIIPRSRGGTEHPSNLRTVCSECHRKYTNELLGSMSIERKMEKLTVFTKSHPPLEVYSDATK